MNKKELQKIIETRPYSVWWYSRISKVWHNCASDGGLINLDDEESCLYEYCVINPNNIQIEDMKKYTVKIEWDK